MQHNLEIQIKLFRTLKDITESFKIRGCQRNEGLIPNKTVFKLISLYNIILQSPYYDWKINYPNCDFQTEYKKSKNSFLNYSILKYKQKKNQSKWKQNQLIGENSILIEENEFIGFLFSIKKILENIIDREIRRTNYIKLRKTYLLDRYDYNYPTNFRAYKAQVNTYRKKLKAEGKKISEKLSDTALKEQFKKIQLEDKYNKNNDINFVKGHFIANYDLVAKIRRDLEWKSAFKGNEYFDWKINYPHFDTLEKYNEHKTVMSLNCDWGDIDDDSKFYEQFNRDGLRALYGGFGDD